PRAGPAARAAGGSGPRAHRSARPPRADGRAGPEPGPSRRRRAPRGPRRGARARTPAHVKRVCVFCGSATGADPAYAAAARELGTELARRRLGLVYGGGGGGPVGGLPPAAPARGGGGGGALPPGPAPPGRP